MEKQTERIGIFEHEGVKYEIGIDKVMDYFREIAYGMSPYIREHPISCRGTIRISQIEPKRRFLGFSYKPTINVFDNILKENGITKKDRLIAICPGAEDALYRMWMPAGFAAVSDYLHQKHKAKVLVLGVKKEYDLCESVRGMARHGHEMINLAGKTTVTQLFYLVEKLDLLITNDTGTMHVAAVQDVKSVSLFGPNLPLRFAPRNKGSVSIYHGDEKRPFINVHKGEIPSTNDRKYYEPIESITVDEVKKACDKVLKNKI